MAPIIGPLAGINDLNLPATPNQPNSLAIGTGPGQLPVPPAQKLLHRLIESISIDELPRIVSLLIRPPKLVFGHLAISFPVHLPFFPPGCRRLALAGIWTGHLARWPCSGTARFETEALPEPRPKDALASYTRFSLMI